MIFLCASFSKTRDGNILLKSFQLSFELAFVVNDLETIAQKASSPYLFLNRHLSLQNPLCGNMHFWWLYLLRAAFFQSVIDFNSHVPLLQPLLAPLNFCFYALTSFPSLLFVLYWTEWSLHFSLWCILAVNYSSWLRTLYLPYQLCYFPLSVEKRISVAPGLLLPPRPQQWQELHNLLLILVKSIDISEPHLLTSCSGFEYQNGNALLKINNTLFFVLSVPRTVMAHSRYLINICGTNI